MEVGKLIKTETHICKEESIECYVCKKKLTTGHSYITDTHMVSDKYGFSRYKSMMRVRRFFHLGCHFFYKPTDL